MINEYNPDTISHPSETLKDVMGGKAISVEDIAEFGNLPKSYIQDVVDGKERIDCHLGKLFNLIFGTHSDFWFNRQLTYDKNQRQSKEEYKNPASTVDLIICNNDSILLIQRKNPPYKGFWALPGGFIDYGKETLEEAAKRELHEETNISVKSSELKLIGVYSNPGRDPRGHTITHVYEPTKCWTNNEGVKAKDDASNISWFHKSSLDKYNLAFDHRFIISEYFKQNGIIS